MFSTSPTRPTTFARACRAATARMAPNTAAAPAMSYFISSMPPAGLIEMPPVSKQTPLPTSATGASPSAPPFQRMIATKGGCTLPWATPSSAPMPIFSSAALSSTSTSSPSLAVPAQASAKAAGVRTFAGSLTRSRAEATTAAMRPADSTGPAASPSRKRRRPSSFSSSGGLERYLGKR